MQILGPTNAKRAIEVFLPRRVLHEIAEEVLFSMPRGITVMAIVKFMEKREMQWLAITDALCDFRHAKKIHL